MRHAAMLVLLVACGRKEFDAVPDGASAADASDAGSADGGVDAAALDPRLAMWFPFAEADPFREQVSGDLPTCTTCPTPAPGPGVRALQFTGTACLAVPVRPRAHAETFTISLWFRPEAVAYGGLFGIGYNEANDSDNSWSYWFNGDLLQFYSFHTAGNNSATFGSAPIGEWHHYAITRDAAGDVMLYVDAGRVLQVVRAPPIYDDSSIHIGCDIDFAAPVDYVQGALADVRFYDAALDPTEVEALAAN